MTILLSIVGLGVLVFIHELGHFVVSVALGMRPRKFYVGFPPAVAKHTRNGIEYGIGMIPLGGFVKIPGMHRPAPADVDHAFGLAVGEAPELASSAERLRRSLDVGDHATARDSLAVLESLATERSFSERATKTFERGITDIGDGLGPDAYWRAATWKRVLVIVAGPAANVLFTVVLFTALFMISGGNATTTVDNVLPGSPAAAMGLQRGDELVSINGEPLSADRISSTISSSRGVPLSMVVIRDGSRVTLLPQAAEERDGAYRLGFLLRGEGLSGGEAAQRSISATGLVAGDIVTSLGRIVTGSGSENIASPIGIVQGSSNAAKQGTETFLWVMGLISLSLALLNLLPLLPLDGGHIVFAIGEGIRGRAVGREIYERVSIIGIGLVLVLFMIGLTNDIGRLS